MKKQKNRLRFGGSVTFVLFFLLSVPGALIAQEYSSTTYTVDDGLASPTINDIAQDITGTMWFATPKGISCYDGTTWKNYSGADGLPFEYYYKIRADKQGNIWAFTRELNDGISFFNSESKQWQHIKGPEDKIGKPAILISSIAFMGSQQAARFGIGTLNNGFYIYTYISTNANKNEHEKHRWVHTGSIPIFCVDSFNHFFYLATDQGLFTVNPAHPDNWRQETIETPFPSIHSVAIEKEPYSPGEKEISPRIRIWLMGKEWLGYYYYSRDHFHSFYRGELPGFKGDYYSNHLVTQPDGFGGLWIGNHFSFLQVTPGPPGSGSAARVLAPLGVSGGYSIFYDRESNLWVGTFRGVIKIVGFVFENYTNRSGLFHDEVTGVQEFGNGNMVLGHNGGFTFLMDNTIETVKFPGIDRRALLDARVLDMCRDSRGNVWAAVSYIGIARIIPARQIKIEWYKNINPHHPFNYHPSVLVDGNGSLWAAVNDRLFKWQDNRFISPKPQIKINCDIRRLFKGRGDSIYIISGTCGLYLLQKGVLLHIIHEEQDIGNSIYAVYAGKEGRVLVGTGKGLFTLRDNALIKFRRRQFHVDAPVYFITEDRDGHLWFGLNNGVIRWDGDQERHYTRQDGLVGSETNRAAGFVDSNNKVWIGTESGVSCYHRERERAKNISPLLELLHLDASGTKYPLNRDITLKYHQNDLTFYFRGISFFDEKAFRYRLKLEGFENQWVNDFQTPYNLIRYTNLPPGNYRFYIQGVNSLGIESPTLSSGMITIKKPFQQTAWFYFLLLFFLLLIIFLITNFISKKRYASRLEEEVDRRTQELERSEKYFREIFENAHDAIIIFEPESETVYDVNQRACDIYGFSRWEFIGMSLEAISKDVGAGKLRIEKTLLTRSYYNFETVQYRKDGSEMFLEINASIINYKGKSAILSINRDVTQRKLAEQETQKSLEEKEVLLKEIHHRVKNNLQIISSLLDLQSEPLEDLRNPQFLQAIQQSRNRIRSMALIHENLYQSGDLARIDVSEYSRDLVDYLLSTYGSQARYITAHIHIESTLLPLCLTMDSAVPIGLILTELISNALKHAFPPGKKGKILIAFYTETPAALTLEVSDNGIGMPRDLDIRQSKTLGLELVTTLTRQVKGTMDVDGRDGTTVKITFPYTPR
jgi:PAS domain S-box-containing protein